ncbi:MAG: GTP-binding protein [bacterium]|nr:MAG: GTP-binding protein [bacterium]
MKETVKIVIVGHVDHGKSTLIGRLLLDTDSLPKEKVEEIKRISKELGKEAELAYLTDQLKEEREQSITIDTTQIFFNTKRKNFVIIDAPGHVEFIKNMMTGAAHAEAAVLIIDTHEGVQEQTRRHAYILHMLGLDRVVAVFNKMDLVDYRQDVFERVKGDFITFAETLGITPVHMVPVSAREGTNISKKSSKMRWYKGESFLKALESMESKAKMERPLRFPIQDVYEIDGDRLIAGRITSGAITEGQRLTVLPSSTDATVDEIRIFGGRKHQAQGGENIAVTLGGDHSVMRGNVLVDHDEKLQPTNRFRGNIFWISERPLQLESTMTLRCSTQEVNCAVERIEKRVDTSTLEVIGENARELGINESGTLVFKTEQPIIVENFAFIEELGRFVVEQGHELLGAGIITETLR